MGIDSIDYERISIISEHVSKCIRKYPEIIEYTKYTIPKSGGSIYYVLNYLLGLFKEIEKYIDEHQNEISITYNKETIRVKIAKNNGKLTVCPFCNRDYINSRGGNKSGAQIDHFYPRANYPIFSLSLYNLIPICGNCNRIKSNSIVKFVSPWDENIDWNKAIKFSYEIEQVDSYKVIIEVEGDARNNIEEMQIREAYSIHSVEVEELLEKQQYYSETQKEEIKNILKDLSISDMDIKRAIFGPEITADKIKSKSLGKMTSDLHKKLGIYSNIFGIILLVFLGFCILTNEYFSKMKDGDKQAEENN